MLKKIMSVGLCAASLVAVGTPVSTRAAMTPPPTVVVTLDGGQVKLNTTLSPAILTFDVSPTGSFAIYNNSPDQMRILVPKLPFGATITVGLCTSGTVSYADSINFREAWLIESQQTCEITASAAGDLVIEHVSSEEKGVMTITGVSDSGAQTESGTSSQPVSLWRAELDPNGGVCTDGGVRRDAEWTKMFVGYGYVPGASDCTRPGFALSGWANVATSDTVRTLPSLIDPSDGKRRFFVAENVDLVAVWEPVVNPPATPSVFVGSLGLFCTDCGVFLLWNAPSDGSSVSVSDPSGAEVCVGATFSLGVWSLCVLPTGVAGTYSLTSQRDGATSLPITTTVA